MKVLHKRLNAKELTLGEFVKVIVLMLHKKGVAMPFQNEEKWHELFYELKREKAKEGRPNFFDRLRFDWDGPYPKSQDLSEYLQALHWNGFVSVANPSYDRLSVDSEVLEAAKQKEIVIEDKALEKFFSSTVEEAVGKFA
jgi:hypothetical protein